MFCHSGHDTKCTVLSGSAFWLSMMTAVLSWFRIKCLGIVLTHTVFTMATNVGCLNIDCTVRTNNSDFYVFKNYSVMMSQSQSSHLKNKWICVQFKQTHKADLCTDYWVCVLCLLLVWNTFILPCLFYSLDMKSN